jgi:phytoene synthase
MMAKILKVSDLNALRGAIDLGIAMQLTNISRDVIEDANLNRFYIMNNFSKLDETIKIADMFYDSSFYALKAIPIRMRFSIIVARRVYRKIGYKVIKLRNFENYTNAGRIYVTGPEKVLETLKSIYDLLRLVMLKKEKDLTKHYHSLVMEEIDYNVRF